MKTIKYIVSIFFLAGLLFTACEVDYLSDPNEPEVAPTYGLMNRVQKRFMDDTRDEWFSGRQVILWVQYWNQVNYTEEDRFQYRETTNQSAWDDIYANAQDLVDLIAFNDVNSDRYVSDMAKFGSHETQIAASQTMLVYIYLHAVELWGDVPYYSFGSTNASFQANQLSTLDAFAPVYAAQSDIYADMLNVLETTAGVFSGATYVMDGDNFFNGDAGQWAKFANSLRLRIANRVGDATHIAGAIADGVMTSNSDIAAVYYEENDLNASPMYRAFVVDARTDFSPSYSFVDLLQGNRGPVAVLDPRLDIFCADNADGNKVGIPLTASNAVVNSFNWESLPGDIIIANQAYPEIYMEYSEVCFILSEVNSWDQTWYEAGVTASMEKWGVAAADITAYIATLPPADEENVLNQKYIALYMQPMEAWSEYRRTGYPTHLIKPGETYNYTWQIAGVDTTASFTFDPIGGLTDMPTRNKYLVNEQNLNKANYDAAVASMGGDEQNTKLWWQN